MKEITEILVATTAGGHVDFDPDDCPNLEYVWGDTLLKVQYDDGVSHFPVENVTQFHVGFRDDEN